MRKTLCVMTFVSSLLWYPSLSFAQDAKGSKETRAYIGTYTKKEGHVDGKAAGIYSVKFNANTGALEFGETLAQVINPSFVKTSPDGKFVYAVSELGPGDGLAGRIYSFRVLVDNSLEEVNFLPTNGFAPCNIEIDGSGKYIFVSNYVGGVVTVFERDAFGKLKEHQIIVFDNKENSHPHSVSLSKDNKIAYVADLGNDKIWIFDFDSENGKLTPNSQPFLALESGSGPRHMALSEDNRFAYSINELNSTVSLLGIDSMGGLKLLQTIASVPDDFKGKNSGADIHIHPSQKFLYVSNRGHNSIAVFRIDSNSGTLENIGFSNTLGKTPRNFAISPQGDFLLVANQDSGSITSFKIDDFSGKLNSDLEPLMIPTPVCIEFAPQAN